MTIGEMIVRLLADTTSFNASMDEAAAKVTASSDAMSASMAASMQSFRNFDNITKESVKSTEGLAEAQAALTAAQSTGAFTSEELAAKQALVDAAMLKVGKETQAASGALSMFTRNSRTMYSTSALITDAMTGQFSRMRREVAALANETGVMAAAFRFVAGPIGIMTGGLVALAAAAITARDHIEEMDRVLLESGNFAGTTSDQMAMMALKISMGGADIKTASDAINALTQSGRVSGEAMQTAARGVADFTALVGGKSSDAIKEATKDFILLGQDPVREIAKLNEQYNFLTASQFDQINALQKEGETTKAAQLAQEAFSNALHTRAVSMKADASDVERAWQKTLAVITGRGEIEQSAATGTMQTRIKAITEELDFLSSHGNREKNTLAPGGLSENPVGAQYVAQLKAERANLEAELQQMNAAAQKEGQAAQSVQDHINSALHPHGKHGAGSASQSSADEQAFQQAQYAAQQQGQEMSLAAQKAWWQKRLAQDQAGGAADANAAATAMRHVVELQKQMDAQSTASGKAAARQRAEAAKEEARKEEEAAKEAAAAKLAADEQTVENAHNIATARLAAEMQGYKLQYDQGRITAAQLLQDKITNLNEQLAADIRHYQGEAKLAAGDAAEQAKWNAAIVIDKLKTTAKLEAVEAAYRDRIKRIDQEIANQKMQSDRMMIDSGFREVNALIAHQETWKQAVLNIGQMVLQRQEDNVAKGIAAALSGEQAKTAAVAAGGMERLAAEAAAEAESLALHAASAVKWIIAEAAKAEAAIIAAFSSLGPWGVVAGIAAAVVVGAEIMNLTSNVASAAGGWERVPADGMMTQLHKDEMVLPARVAEPMRNMARNGGGGGVHHYHVQSWDSRDLGRFVRQHGATLSHAMSGLRRNGY